MRKQNLKRLGITVDPELHYKLRYIAKYEGRSMSKQILFFIRGNIELFELKYGKIPMEEEEQ